MSLVDGFRRRTADFALALDGWLNEYTGIGTSRDKAAATAWCLEQSPLPYEVCESLYNFNDIAATGIGQIVLDSMGDGFKLKRQADSDDKQKKADEQAAAILRKLKQHNVFGLMTQAATWGRMCGGGAILLGLEGAGAYDKPVPVDENGKIKASAKIKFLRVATKRELSVYQYDDKGQAELYNFCPVVMGGKPGDLLQQGAMIVHRSRLLMFGGVLTAPMTKLANQGWDLSVLDRVWHAMQGSATKWDSVTHMFSDMSQGVFKIRGLIGMLAQGREGQDAVTERVRMLDRYKSVARSIVLDAGRPGENSEEYSLVERTAMTGLDTLLGKDLLRLCMAFRMPATVLVGMSPAGLSTDDESGKQNWLKQCGNYRTLTLGPVAETLIGLAANELGYDAEGWDIEWPPLLIQTDKEKAETTKIKVDTAAVCVDKFGVLPEEVALSLDTLGVDIEIDREVRQTVLEQSLADMENPPEPVLPGDPNADPNADPEADPAQKPGAGAVPGRPGAAPAKPVDPEADPRAAARPGATPPPKR